MKAFNFYLNNYTYSSLSIGSWQTVTFNSCSTSAIGLIIRGITTNNSRVLNFRKYGSTDNYISIQNSLYTTYIVGIDSAKRFQYYSNSPDHSFFILGEVLDSGSYLFTNKIDLGINTAAGWQTIDCTSHLLAADVGNVEAFIVSAETDDEQKECNIRGVGSIDVLNIYIPGVKGYVVKANSLDQFEVDTQGDLSKLYLSGYVRKNAEYTAYLNGKQSSNSLSGGAGAWNTVDINTPSSITKASFVYTDQKLQMRNIGSAQPYIPGAFGNNGFTGLINKKTEYTSSINATVITYNLGDSPARQAAYTGNYSKEIKIGEDDTKLEWRIINDGGNLKFMFKADIDYLLKETIS